MLNEKLEVLEYVTDTNPESDIRTLADLFLRFTTKFKKPDAFKFKRKGEWVDVSTDEFALRVKDLFFALHALGVKSGDPEIYQPRVMRLDSLYEIGRVASIDTPASLGRCAASINPESVATIIYTSVGDVEIRIAADGEILVRGSNVMKGYYGLKRETDEAFKGGWFHTGDIGELDIEGYLRITDRKKDLIVTSSGKNIAPQPIENRLKLIPYFENVVVIGDGRSFVSALVVPNHPALEACARANGVAYEKPADLVRNREVYELAMREIGRLTEDFSSFEKVRKIAFLDGEFTIDGGELTPTMKVRRSTIEKKYKAEIDQLYEPAIS